MAENIELIAAANLPTTEAEEVSVLCIDNGELKQKPGASFGGGGGYITVADSLDMESMTGVINENYDNFVDILLAGGSVWINMASAIGTPVYAMVMNWWHAGAAGLSLVISVGGQAVTLDCPNGTWMPEE